MPTQAPSKDMAAPLTKAEVEQYLSSVDLRNPLENALNTAVSNLTQGRTPWHVPGQNANCP